MNNNRQSDIQNLGSQSDNFQLPIGLSLDIQDVLDTLSQQNTTAITLTAQEQVIHTQFVQKQEACLVQSKEPQTCETSDDLTCKKTRSRNKHVLYEFENTQKQGKKCKMFRMYW
jgi:hypothetical protein